MAEEIFKQGGAVCQAKGFAPDGVADLGKVIWCKVGEPSILQIVPHLFLRLQLRRVRWLPHHVPMEMGSKVATNLAVPVGTPAVPKQEERSGEMLPEVPQEFKDMRPTDVLAGMETEVQGDSSSMRRDDQCTDRGGLFVGASADRHQRRVAAERPSAAEQRGHQKTCFVQTNQVPAEPGKFFLARAQSSWIHSRTRWSTRSLARRWGRCGENPQARGSRPT